MYKLLFKTEIKSLFFRKKKSKFPMWLTYIAIGAFVAVSFFFTYDQTVQELAVFGLGDLFFSFAGSMVFAMNLFINISMVENRLFQSKYNDVLLSMPIKASDILISRMLMIVAYNYAIELVFGGPAIVAWIVEMGFDLGILLRFIAIMLIWPLISISLGTLLGYLLMRISARSRHKNLVKTVIYFVFLMLIMAVNMIPTADVEKALIDAGIMDPNSTISIINWFGRAVLYGDVASIIKLIVLCIVPFVGMLYWVSRKYFQTMSESIGSVKIEYKEKALKTHSVLQSLIIREIRHLFNSFTYMMNTVMAIFMLLMGNIALLIFWERFFSDLIPLVGNLSIGIFALLMVLTMECSFMFSATSISIEGASMEAIKTFPIDTNTIIWSKLLTHYLLMAPVVLMSSIVLLIKCQPPLRYAISFVLLPQCFLIMMDSLGLWLNLRHYNLDWANEAQVVKRSLPVFLLMIIGFAVIGLSVALYLIKRYEIFNIDTYMLIWTGIIGLIGIGFCLLDITKGVKLFNRIS